jgi:type IV secretory pathway protease TraF
VGLSGEVVTIDTGQIFIDGTADRDPWGQGHTAPDGEWTVPDGRFFVISDQRAQTRDDSRNFGPIEASGLYRMVFLTNRLFNPRLSFPSN